MKENTILALLTICSFMAYSQSFDPEIITDDFIGGNSIVYSDFNEDGVNEYIVARANEKVVTMLYYDGAELIQKDLLTVDGAIDIATGDFDMDGKIDIAIAAQKAAGIRILRNLGDFEFSIQTISTDDFENPVTISASDIDQDGDLDLVAASTSGTDIVIYELVDPSAFVFNVKLLDDIVCIKDVNVVDLDNDGFPDIVGTNVFQNQLNIFFNQGDLNFQKLSYPLKGSFRNSIADFNKDGFQDIGVTTFSDGELFVFLNNGNRTFDEKLIDASISNAFFINCFDINQDDISDIIVGTDEGLTVYLIENISTNLHTKEVYPNDGWIGPFDIVDIDGDEDLDVVAISTSIPGIIHYENVSIASSTTELDQMATTVYPNPVRDVINFEVGEAVDFEASLYTLEGKLIKVSSNTKQMRVETIPAGTYLFKIKNFKTGKTDIEQIVIVR